MKYHIFFRMKKLMPKMFTHQAVQLVQSGKEQ